MGKPVGVRVPPHGDSDPGVDAERVARKRATLWSPSVARPAAKADGQKAEAQAVESPGTRAQDVAPTE